ncbi:hypothetical protein E5983_01020 [Streptococcus danieliae]|uniref:Uncharacterized protein n=1 Tax=Streptococcus danieliae TaxID=747656 RepID=A0A7X3KB64_9STRE|nr:hypothetical protein [Streptococcus danieliae]MVX58255.1 hypothetical protein [Streptococcus danieliae]
MNWGEVTGLLTAVGALLGIGHKIVSELQANNRKNSQIVADMAEVKSGVSEIRESALKNSDGLKTLHSYRLAHDMKADILRGYTTLDRKQAIAKLFESYKKLGGNGEIELLYHEFVELPLKEEENHETR